MLLCLQIRQHGSRRIPETDQAHAPVTIARYGSKLARHQSTNRTQDEYAPNNGDRKYEPESDYWMVFVIGERVVER